MAFFPPSFLFFKDLWRFKESSAEIAESARPSLSDYLKAGLVLFFPLVLSVNCALLLFSTSFARMPPDFMNDDSEETAERVALLL